MELVDQALMLSTLPYGGARMRGNPRARKLVYGKYLIVYTIDETRHYVAVLRFLHSARIK
jgi:plasmid stabilization system protein ParE